MAHKDLIGHMDCPECGKSGAEVREDKSGAPYRFCPDCTAQYFTRGRPDKVRNLLGKITPAKAAQDAAQPTALPAAKPTPTPAPAKPKAAPPAPPAKPTPAPTKPTQTTPPANPWSPLIGA